MSPTKTQKYKTRAELRAESLQRAAQIADAAKRKAMKEASAQMGLCGIIALALLLTAIAIPAAGMLLLFA